ncbi:hypothetical protein L6164_006572 [Bauhinia variegata]|uniref:Uncharacterized protein n=1 Tax=Bauhinia variegata TaxID=167791 RepID=A0ACB9PUW6_BAUVA|nr:hypothetical protein L6164_006572 [Bauhinia variegata]
MKGDTVAVMAQQDSISEEELVLSMVDSQVQLDQWVIDSGCSYHMCPNKEWFESYEETENSLSHMWRRMGGVF